MHVGNESNRASLAAEVALFEDQREEAYKLGGFDEYKIAIEETELYMAATVTK